MLTKTQLPLHKHISRAICIVFAVMFTLIGILSYAYTNHLMIEKTKQSLEVSLLQTQSLMTTRINRIDEILLSPCNDKLLFKSLTEIPDNPHSKQQELNTYFINNIRIPLLRYFSSFHYCIYLDPDLSTASLFLSEDSNATIRHLGSASDQLWLRETKKADGKLCWFYDPENPEYLYAAREIRGFFTPYSTTEVGVIRLRLNIRDFFSQITDSELTPNSHTYYTLDKKFFYPLTNSAPSLSENSIDINTSNELLQTISLDGKQYLFSCSDLSDTGYLVHLTPLSDVRHGTDYLLLFFVCITLFSIFIAILLSGAIARMISKPVFTLSKMMQDTVDEQSLNQTVPTDFNVLEISNLYHSFQLLTQQVQKLLVDIHTREATIRKAELRTLQSQINPHFLYNTLDSISWAAINTGNREIPAVISNLSTILRYGLKGFEETVSIEEELSLAKQYVSIQCFCYSLDVQLKTDLTNPQNRRYKMPKLTLQPLVENAILHGMLDHGIKKDIIYIRTILRNDQLIVQVESNGAADIDAMYRLIHDPVETEKHGIRNIHQRLTLLYGEDHGLVFRNTCTGGLIVEFSLPPITL